MYKRLSAQYLPNGMAIISGPCFMTGETYSVEATQKQWELYKNGGVKVQDAFPNMTREDREFLISGTSPKAWDDLFGGDDDEPEISIKIKVN